MERVLTMSVPGGPEYIPVVKNAVQTLASIRKCDMETLDDIGMAVFEACKVIVCHECDGWCESYDLEVNCDGKIFEIKLIASEAAYGKRKTFQMCENCPKDGDLGIAVINTLMEECEIDHEGKGRKSIVMRKVCKGR